MKKSNLVAIFAASAVVVSALTIHALGTVKTNEGTAASQAKNTQSQSSLSVGTLELGKTYLGTFPSEDYLYYKFTAPENGNYSVA
jgi:hypothetical protein